VHSKYVGMSLSVMTQLIIWAVHICNCVLVRGLFAMGDCDGDEVGMCCEWG
jgi:hypothetical protein